MNASSTQVKMVLNNKIKGPTWSVGSNHTPSSLIVLFFTIRILQLTLLCLS